ncbi:putative nuclease HARBI1 isoform X1 [Bacillus rossius redtenbacheri]|uniref:putative nuclease HARBI1 isoform X1 n=1 Tax=Bacillus rossius redtenbacheri TaxID=93214 RepID=UPI002FDE5DD3
MDIMDSSSSSSSSGSDEERERRVQRVFRPRINLTFNFSDFVFKEKFRVSKVTAEYIINRLGPQLRTETKRNHALTVQEQLLCALHWLGTGAQYHVNADAHGLSKATIHRCVKKLCHLLVHTFLGEEVRWPTESVQAIPQLFMSVANIPRVAGVVDGSLIKIDAPHDNEVSFVDRNGNHSINIMVVCGPNLEFLYASARWPGSVHDARVLRCSSLSQQWENGWRPFPHAILLGDSGYGLKKWLITPNIPVQIPRTNALTSFLRAFKSTRRLVENALGILKEKFPCLNHLRMQPVSACNIILSCIIVHNIEKRLGSEVYEPYENDENVEGEDGEAHEDVDAADPEAIAVLQELIHVFEH